MRFFEGQLFANLSMPGIAAFLGAIRLPGDEKKMRNIAPTWRNQIGSGRHSHFVPIWLALAIFSKRLTIFLAKSVTSDIGPELLDRVEYRGFVDGQPASSRTGLRDQLA